MGTLNVDPAEAVGHSQCKVCLGIDTRRPFCGPLVSPANSDTIVRVWYGHAQAIHELLTSALEGSCHLCYLILDSIRRHYVLISNQKNVLDDWDYVDDIDDFDDGEDGNDNNNDGYSSEKYEKYRKFFDEAGAEASFDDVNETKSPIVLEFVFRVPRRDELASRCIDVIVHWTQTGGRARLNSSALSLVSQIPDDLSRLCQARDIENDTSTDSIYSFDLARLWLRRCDSEHELCAKRKEQRELLLPTRVIDVADVLSGPRLVESPKGQAADYVCLSHCWGNSQPFRTEKGSIAKRKAGMDIDAMPKTFRDTIIVTRNLGIQYLWIDSLCIIQDSVEDWARESAQMGKIYRDATLTIFAEHANSDDGGCFSSRSGQASALCRTPMFDSLVSFIGGDAIHATSTFIQAKLHHAGGHSLPERHSIFETIKTLDRRTVPLNLRAWVLQESILSHRALLYDNNEVRWSCPTMKACECIPEGHIRQSWSNFDKGDIETISTRELSNSWALIVHEFSTRGLTYNKDKLPALAGIASEMQRYKNSTYLAGLWKDDLRINLAWFVFPRSAGAPYRETLRIQDSSTPSWSWAKIKGEVRMRIHYDDLHSKTEPKHDKNDFTRAQSRLCKIIQCKTTPLNTLNPFGEVRAGLLQLHGHLCQAKCCTPITDTSHIDRIPVEDPESNLQLGWFDPDVSPIPGDNPIYDIRCMPLFNNSGKVVCLALVPASAHQAERAMTEYPSARGRMFERVGVVSPRMGYPHGTRSAETMKRMSAGTTVEHDNAFLMWIERHEEETVVVI